MVLKSKSKKYKNINITTINPKAVNSNGLYGYVNLLTNEWHDGIVAKLVRQCAEQTNANN